MLYKQVVYPYQAFFTVVIAIYHVFRSTIEIALFYLQCGYEGASLVVQGTSVAISFIAANYTFLAFVSHVM